MSRGREIRKHDRTEDLKFHQRSGVYTLFSWFRDERCRNYSALEKELFVPSEFFIYFMCHQVFVPFLRNSMISFITTDFCTCFSNDANKIPYLFTECAQQIHSFGSHFPCQINHYSYLTFIARYAVIFAFWKTFGSRKS